MKKISFSVKNFVGLQRALTDLYLQGYIAGFKQFKITDTDFVEVFLKPDCAANWSHALVKLGEKPSRDLVINLKQLKAAEKNEPFSTGLVRTKMLGLTTTKNAIANKEGGVFIARVK